MRESPSSESGDRRLRRCTRVNVDKDGCYCLPSTESGGTHSIHNGRTEANWPHAGHASALRRQLRQDEACWRSAGSQALFIQAQMARSEAVARSGGSWPARGGDDRSQKRGAWRSIRAIGPMDRQNPTHLHQYRVVPDTCTVQNCEPDMVVDTFPHRTTSRLPLWLR